MKQGLCILLGGLLGGTAGPIPAEEAPVASDAGFGARVKPFITAHCASCHSGEEPKGDLDLTGLEEASVASQSAVWVEVVERTRKGSMPPKARPRPSADEIREVTGWIESRLPRVDCEDADPGRVTLRRLNRAEYRNTIRDLLGVDFQPTEDFPSDDVGYGFDNIGDVLSLSPILLEKYLAAAETISAIPGVVEKLIPCKLEGRRRRDCARQVIEALVARAYRRPAREEDVKRLLQFTDLAEENGDGPVKGIRLALQAVLVSPRFLFRVEEDPEGAAPGSVRELDEFELATRLSYFLWSSMPDDELFRVAKEGKLRETLETQVRRMLADPRSKSLADEFASQWLQTRNLRTVSPDQALFPAFDEELRSAMEEETRLFFEAVVREDRSILDFIEGDFTYVNERLARLYGIEGVEGKEPRRVSLAGTPRRGVLMHASVLTVTSNPTRTSPVKRGKWVLEQILGEPPPPPPASVPDLEEGPAAALSGTLRQRMEQHRADPNCSVCHETMDALGFGLENFDPVGGWREKDGPFEIDASGALPAGDRFDGPEGLRVILKARKDAFARCLAEKVLTFALGRGLEATDRCAVNEIVLGLEKDGHRFSRLIIEVSKTRPFQKKRTGASTR